MNVVCECSAIMAKGAASLPAGGTFCRGCGSIFTTEGTEASEAVQTAANRVICVRAGRELIDAVEAYLATGLLAEAVELRKAAESAVSRYFRVLGDKRPPQATVYTAMHYAREAAERYPELSRGGIR